MKNFLILIFSIQFSFCSTSEKKPVNNNLLTFEEVFEIFNLDTNTKDKVLKSKGFKLIRVENEKKDYTKSDTICIGEGIFLENTNSLVYYLNGSKYKSHYESIKNKMEKKGFIFLTTKQKENGNFLEIYTDTATNNVGIIFSILKPLSDENACDVEGYRIRFASK